MIKFSNYLKIVSVGAAFGAFAMAHAVDQIEYVGPDAPSQAVSISYTGQFSNLGTDAGFLKFQVTQGNNGVNNPFEAVCGDIFHDISGGSTYADTVHIASETPAFGGASSAFTTNASILAAGNIVGNTFNNAWAHSGAGTANEQGAALQLAVWAAEYDFADATVTNQTTFNNMLTTGHSNTGLMTISGAAASDSQTMADAYADWLTKGTTPGAGDVTLFLKGGAMVGGGVGQDQWTEQSSYSPSGSPEPFTMGIGIAGVAFAIRRKVKRSK